MNKKARAVKCNRAIIVVLICAILLLAGIYALGLQNNNTVYAETTSSIFTFTVTSDTECSVRLTDRTVKKAIVPRTATINGINYTVTSVAGSGFSSASNLKKVRLPETIKSIGNSAFANCGALSSITMPGVESIGTSAFNNCKSLEYLIIPNSINLVAPTILRGCNTKVYVRISEAETQELGWATNWNGNNSNQSVEYSSNYTPEIEYEEVLSPSSRSTLSEGNTTGYYVADEQPFSEIREDDIYVYIPETYKGKPVVGIMDYAFSTNRIDYLTIGYAETPIHIDSYAFEQMEGTSVTINRDIDINIVDWEGKNSLAEGLFVNSKVSKIILPNSINAIGPRMFNWCENLTDIHFIEPQRLTKSEEEAISGQMVSTGIVELPATEQFTTISEEAFSGATSIQKLYIPNNVTTVGANILVNWGEGQLVSIDYEKEADLPQWSETTQQGWNPYWKEGCSSNIIEFQGEFSITYHLNGGTHSGNPDTYMPKDNIIFNAPTRLGYTFEGWYDNALFSGSPVGGIPKGESGDKEFFAKWSANPYIVIYESNKPEHASNEISGNTPDSTHVYNTASNLRPNAYSLTGWTFVGWNTEEDGSGEAFSDGAIVTTLSYGEPVQLFAQWTPNPYTVSYVSNKPNNATGLLTGNMDPTNHIYDTASPLRENTLTLEGWTFVGWNTKPDGSGKAFSDQGMVSTGPLNLFAQWTPNPYTISYHNNKPNDATGLLTGNMDPTNHIYDTASPLRKNTLTLEGWTFVGWNAESNGSGKAFSDQGMVSTGPTILYAQWTENQYVVRFDKQGGTGGEDGVEVWFDNAMPSSTAPSRTGFTFEGYYNDKGVKYYNKDMTSARTWNIASDTKLYAKWLANPYTVTLDKQGGSGGSDEVTAEYSSSMPVAAAPSRTGFTFEGYYNGAGVKYYNKDMTSARPWDIASNTKLYADWSKNKYTVTFDKQGGSGGSDEVTAEYSSSMPVAAAPSRTGFTFEGYYTLPNGAGVKYYNKDMTSARTWNIASNTTLYADWSENPYRVTFDKQGGSGGANYTTAKYSLALPKEGKPSRTHYHFRGYWTGKNGTGTQYYDLNMNGLRNWDIPNATTLYAYWEPARYSVSIRTYHTSNALTMTTSGAGSPAIVDNPTYTFEQDESFTFQDYQPDPPYMPIPGVLAGKLNGIYVTYLNTGKAVPKDYYIKEGNSVTLKANCFSENDDILVTAEYIPHSCVAAGSLITLADGSQKAVETLTGKEELLVWNLFTGRFESAPILFIDKDSSMEYEVIKLTFSDGTVVKVIDEHGFWDFDLNEYVFLRSDAAQYIGHWFNKQTTDAAGNLTYKRVQLTNVVISNETTTAWSPVTFGHLCYYVNGMLSMPGATTGLINIFDVDPDTMKIDEAAYLADIEEYGLFTYEEFAALYPVPEVIFEAFGGQYLKVAMGKGLLTEEMLVSLLETYAEFFDAEVEEAPESSDSNKGNNGNHYGHSKGNNGNHYGHEKGDKGRGKK